MQNRSPHSRTLPFPSHVQAKKTELSLSRGPSAGRAGAQSRGAQRREGFFAAGSFVEAVAFEMGRVRMCRNWCEGGAIARQQRRTECSITPLSSCPRCCPAFVPEPPRLWLPRFSSSLTWTKALVSSLVGWSILQPLSEGVSLRHTSHQASLPPRTFDGSLWPVRLALTSDPGSKAFGHEPLLPPHSLLSGHTGAISKTQVGDAFLSLCPNPSLCLECPPCLLQPSPPPRVMLFGATPPLTLAGTIA